MFLAEWPFFWRPIPWMIQVALILSAVLRRWPDVIIVAVLLVFNAGVGFWLPRPACAGRADWLPGPRAARPAATMQSRHGKRHERDV